MRFVPIYQCSGLKKTKVLGIIFEDDDGAMCANNFDIKFREMQGAINVWSKRYLTVYGKITIVKSLLLPNLHTYLLRCGAQVLSSLKN